MAGTISVTAKEIFLVEVNASHRDAEAAGVMINPHLHHPKGHPKLL